MVVFSESQMHNVLFFRAGELLGRWPVVRENVVMCHLQTTFSHSDSGYLQRTEWLWGSGSLCDDRGWLQIGGHWCSQPLCLVCPPLSVGLLLGSWKHALSPDTGVVAVGPSLSRYSILCRSYLYWQFTSGFGVQRHHAQSCWVKSKANKTWNKSVWVKVLLIWQAVYFVYLCCFYK